MTLRKSRPEHQDNRAALFFLAPWLVGLLFITAGPLLASLGLSFTDYNLLQEPSWIGLENFVQAFGDERLLQSIRVTFTYVFVAVPIQLTFALALAVLFNRSMRGQAFYRSVFYLPSMLAASVAIAVLWRQMFNTDGVINLLLAVVGIDGPGWTANPDLALGTVIMLHVWTFGSPMVIFLAGLRQIPTMYDEAAMMDGAGRVQRFLRVTLPLLTPMIFFNFVLQTIGAFQSFTQAFIVSGGTGGPADSTLLMTLYLYQQGFGQLQMGYASAIAWILVVIIGLFTATNFFLSRYWVYYDD